MRVDDNRSLPRSPILRVEFNRHTSDQPLDSHRLNEPFSRTHYVWLYPVAAVVWCDAFREIRDGRVPNEAEGEFWRATADAEFLFGPGVVEYLDLVYRKAGDLHYHYVSIDPAHGEDRSKHATAESELVLWFAGQFKGNLKSKFAPYLSFGAWTA